MKWDVKHDRANWIAISKRTRSEDMERLTDA